MTGWLDKLTTWLMGIITAVVDAIGEFFTDLGVWAFEQVTDIAAYVINAIPAPEFLTTYSLGTILGSTGSPWIGWACETCRVSECFAVLAAGVAFNLLRKLLTLGQW